MICIEIVIGKPFLAVRMLTWNNAAGVRLIVAELGTIRLFHNSLFQNSLFQDSLFQDVDFKEAYCKMLISIIIPTLNEFKRLPRCINQIRALEEAEGPLQVIVVDGGSDDGTQKQVQLSDKIIHSPRGRGIQCNSGAQIADGEILFFLHATVSVPVGALSAIRETIRSGYAGGGFNNSFVGINEKTLRLRRVLTLGLPNSNHEKNLSFYGDNGIFVRKDVFEELDGFKEIEIMEDYDFSKRMRENYSVKRILEPRLRVSPRRQIRNGLLKTRIQWITLQALYDLGVPPKRLKRLYSDIR